MKHLARSLLLSSLLAGCGASAFTPDASTDTPADAVGDTAVARGDTAPTPTGDAPPAVDSSRPPTVDAGPPAPCPSSLDGDGLACARPGEGCGTGGPCGSVTCMCGFDNRWRCTGTNTCDGGRPDVGAVCTFGGTYFVDREGDRFWFRFNPDGSWVAAPSERELDGAAAARGTWSVSGPRLTLRDRSCGDAAGQYLLEFGDRCGSATLALVEDACGERGTALDGATFRRSDGTEPSPPPRDGGAPTPIADAGEPDPPPPIPDAG